MNDLSIEIKYENDKKDFFVLNAISKDITIMGIVVKKLSRGVAIEPPKNSKGFYTCKFSKNFEDEILKFLNI